MDDLSASPSATHRNFACTECGALFNRAQHLKRHQTKHQFHRPLHCPNCNAGFKRRDSLQRHMKTHAEMAEGRGISPKRRHVRGVKHACQNCARSKLRCDGQNPCSRCQFKTSICRYPKSAVAAPELLNSLGCQRSAPTPDETSSTGDPAAFAQTAPQGPPWNISTNVCTAQPSSLCILSSGDSAVPYAQNISPISTVDQNQMPLDLQYMATDLPYTANDDLAFWYGPEYPLPSCAQDLGFQLPLSEAHLDTTLQNGPPSSNSTKIFPPPLSLKEAPVITLLEARTGPEPQDGQVLGFNDCFHSIRKKESRLPGDRAQNRSTQISIEPIVPSSTFGKSTLMGSFPAVLCTESGNDGLWEPENFSHVRPMTQAAYNDILVNYEQLNTMNGGFATGYLPSIAAMNAFLQLYFEYFHPLLPFLHLPTFDCGEEHWIVVLAVVTTGCRYSQVPEVMECVYLLEEFLRRAIQSQIEQHYSSTCQPWLAQAALLNTIGMQHAREIRQMEHAQINRSLIATLCRKVNCFAEPAPVLQVLHNEDSLVETWKIWIDQEKMRRLAYTAWLVDSQHTLFVDLPPLVPIELLRVRLPISESVWNAQDATSWREQICKNETYHPIDLRSELSALYRTKSCPQGIGDFSTLLLLIGIARDTIQVRRSDRSSLVFGSFKDIGKNREHFTLTIHGDPCGDEAMEYLQVLCPNDCDTPRRPCLKSVILQHYHTIAILLRIPLRELYCYCGFRVSSVDMIHCRNRFQRWFQDEGISARQTVLHAGKLFGLIRNSDMHGYHECRSMLVACLALWVYGDLGNLQQSSNSKTGPGASQTENHGSKVTIRLDRPLTGSVLQDWLRNGSHARPYLTGVGDISGDDGVLRLVKEGSRILSATSTWPISEPMGNVLTVYHDLRSKGRSQ